jgi:hypothetical protein
MSEKRPSRVSSTPERLQKGITFDVKHDILRVFDAGENLSCVAGILVLVPSAVGTHLHIQCLSVEK